MSRFPRIRALLATAVALAAVPGLAQAATNGPIAYVRSDSAAGSAPQIWLMGPDGANQGPLTSTAGANYSHPSFSTGGALLAYAAQGPTSVDVFTMNFSGTGVTDLGPDNGTDSSPAMSPDGTKVAYSVYDGTDYEIFVRPTSGAAATQLTNNGAGVDDLNPTWSPDGTKIAFSSTRSGSYDIWVMNADGSSPTALTNTVSTVNAQYVREQYPAWSPDGTQIAYTRMESNQINDLEAFDIWLMSSTGANQHKSTGSSSVKDSQPTWSPDGTKIAFASDRATTGDDIWIMNADGSGATDLTGTASPVSEAQPAWTQPQQPSASWSGAAPIAGSSAQINGKVAVSCLSGTWYVEWAQGTQLPLTGGTKTAVQNTTACAPTPVSTTLTGLTPNTTYTARFVSQNSLGTAATNAQTFTTTTDAPSGAGGGGTDTGSGSGGSTPTGTGSTVTPPYAAPPRGTAGNDRLIGGPGRDVLKGFSGDDVLAGLGGSDLLEGGPGRDILDGGRGNDQLLGGSGNDDLDAGPGNDNADGGAGNDIVRGGPGNDTLTGGSGGDRIFGGAGNDTINAIDGRRDRIDCGAGKKDRVYADRSDKLHGCERVSHKRPRPNKQPYSVPR